MISGTAPANRRMLQIFTDKNLWLPLASVLSVFYCVATNAQQVISLGRLPDGNEVRVEQNSDKSYGLRISRTADIAFPVQFLVTGTAEEQATGVLYGERRLGYKTVRRMNDTLIGTVDSGYPTPAKNNVNLVRVVDKWLLRNEELQLWRQVEILADDSRGFATSIYLNQRVTDSAQVASAERLSGFTRNLFDLFMPGLTYGTTDNLPSKAIGALATYSKANSQLRVREDRFPIPLVAVRMQNGLSISVLHRQPTGETTREDSENFVKNGPDTASRRAPRKLIDERFGVGALQADLLEGTSTYAMDAIENQLHLGYIYPAMEGSVTYRGNVYPDVGENVKRWNFHPLKKGFTQQYSLIFRFTKTGDFSQLMRDSWRWAWNKLQPQVNRHDIDLARRSLVQTLSSQIEEHNGLTGITNWRPAVPNDAAKRDPKTVMGFTGKALETAEFLLWASDHLKDDPNAATYRKQGEALFASFVKTVKLDPPNGEGFVMETGKPALAIPQDKQVYLRSFGDDLKATLRAYRHEKKHGRDHKEWLTWAKTFGDWLLTQQRTDGGIPRAWKPETGEVSDLSATSTYNAVPFLMLLAELTETSDRGNEQYQQAAIRAGEYAWTQSGQRFGRFTGGTIDNPDVLDKEAGTLSFEAYLALYEKTKEVKWLDRAKAAADFAETWIYAWNVPMPADADDRTLHWKKGVSTVGLQLISTGHSLADAYMAFDVDEYAKLYKYTGDKHYLDVAKILLHNTLAMTGMPGRSYDLRGPGWQQEHWSLAPWRGHGFHRGWLPWVSTSHLNGMIGLDEFDKKLYDELSRAK